MSGDIRDIVEEPPCRMAEDDHDRTVRSFAEPIGWRPDRPAERHPAVPWVRPRSGRADVADHFGSLGAHHMSGLNGTSVIRTLVDGAHTVVPGEITRTARDDGAYTSPFAPHLTIEDGFVTLCHVYEDSLTVPRALGA